MTAHSIRQRLKNKADELGLEFQQILQYYAIERFLYRLSMTEWSGQLIVKGATMLRVWDGAVARPTRDIDFLSRISSAEVTLKDVISDCIEAEVFEDGLHWEQVDSAEPVTIAGRYPGQRLKIRGNLHGARFVLSIDVGLGDATEPEPGWVDYPVLLDNPAPRILTYAPETAIAEKFEAIVHLGLVNSRMKDYYDIWMLGRSAQISPSDLVAAVKATFARRNTPIPEEPPEGLAEAFQAQETSRQQWKAFAARLRESGISVPEELSEVIRSINALLMPVYESH